MRNCPTKCSRWSVNSTCCSSACSAPLTRRSILWPMPRTNCARPWPRCACSCRACAAQARSMDVGLLHSDAANVTVRGDAEALRMLARNLLDNAIKYTPPGGRVDLQVRREGDAAVLTVEDSGPGIAPEHRERVMQRFVRETSEGAPGSGLGLAIVQAIAQGHGATVQLSASPRLGGLLVTVRFG